MSFLVLAAVPLVLGAGGRPPDRLPALVAELRRTPDAGFGCFDGEPSLRGASDVRSLVAAYQQGRRLRSAEAARALLEARIEYALRPTTRAFETQRDLLRAHGNPAAAAEDVCRCLYYNDRGDRPSRMEQVEPTSIGAFWAGRVHHQQGRTQRALDAYGKALAADPSNPRTRLFAAIASIEEERPREALDLLSGIAPTWAPGPVAYW